MLLPPMRRLWIGVVAFGLLAMGWGQARADSAVGKVLTGQYSATAAMNALYGNYDAGSKSSLLAPKRGAAYEPSWPSKVRVKIVTDSSYTDDSVPRHVLVTWARPDEKSDGQYTCHACGVLLGVSVFRQEQGNWKVEASALQLVETGAWGQPPQVKVQRLGEHTWGLVMQMGDMHQGETEQALWVYGPKSGEFAEWFRAELADMNPERGFKDDWCGTRSSGDMDVMCVWKRLDYSLVPEAGKEMYELVRTERAKGREVQTYWRFVGGKYVAAAKP